MLPGVYPAGRLPGRPGLLVIVYYTISILPVKSPMAPTGEFSGAEARGKPINPKEQSKDGAALHNGEFAVIIFRPGDPRRATPRARQFAIRPFT